MNSSTVSQRFARLCRIKRKSIADIAKETGLTIQYLHRLKSGRRKHSPSFAVVAKLARALGVDVSQFQNPN